MSGFWIWIKWILCKILCSQAINKTILSELPEGRDPDSQRRSVPDRGDQLRGDLPQVGARDGCGGGGRAQLPRLPGDLQTPD